MSNYAELPIETNALALVEEALAQIEATIEGWNAASAEYETILIEAIVNRLVVPLAQMASEVPSTIFNEWGRKIVDVQPHVSAAATAKTKWKAKDNAGYTIPAGTQVSIPRTGSEAIGFTVVNEVQILPGATEAPAVLLEATEVGTEGNGLKGTAELVDALGWVTSIEVEGESSGGEDAEDGLVYLNRLAETMRTLIEGVVTARDAEIVTRNVPGVGRALCLDNYNAETKATEQEKTTTMVVTDALGNACSAEVKAAALAKLKSKREINFIFFVIDATYHSIDATAVVVEQVGYSHAEAVANAKAAINDFLSPLIAGQQPAGDATSWVNVELIRFQDLSAIVNNAEGVDHWTTLKLALHSGTQKAEDLTLTGPAALPTVGTISVS